MRRRYAARRRLSSDDFARVVDDALATLPARFAAMLENIVIVIEDEPNDDDLESLADDGEGEADAEILGIYRGVALTDRGNGDVPLVPDEIAIFSGPIGRIARTRGEAVREVRETVMHELGHYFGLDHDDMPY